MMNRTEIESLVKSALVFFKHESWCSCMNSEMFRNPLSYFGISDLNILNELYKVADAIIVLKNKYKLQHLMVESETVEKFSN